MSSTRASVKLAFGLVCLASVAVADVVAGKTWWWMRERAGQNNRRLEKQYRIAHPYYHHDLKPNYSTDSAVWGPIIYPLRTNSLGFRDARVRDVPPADSTARVLLIGDSFTEGLGVPFDSTFAGRLAHTYSAAGVELLNAGVLSYSPAIYWKKIEYLLNDRRLRIDAVVVFIDVSDIHDEAVHYRIDGAGHVVDAPEPRPGFFARWAHNSFLLRSVSKVVRLIHPHAPYGGCFEADTGDIDCRSGWTLSNTVMKRYGSRGLALANEHMTRLAGLLGERKIPLTVVVYPWPQQLQWNDRSSRQVSYWEGWAQSVGAQFVSLFAPFFAQVDARGLDSTIARYFISDDVHWNATGHAFVAETFGAKYVPPIPPMRRR